MNQTPRDTAIPGHTGLWSNVIGEVLQYLQISGIGVSSPDTV